MPENGRSRSSQRGQVETSLVSVHYLGAHVNFTTHIGAAYIARLQSCAFGELRSHDFADQELATYV